MSWWKYLLSQSEGNTFLGIDLFFVVGYEFSEFSNFPSKCGILYPSIFIFFMPSCYPEGENRDLQQLGRAMHTLGVRIEKGLPVRQLIEEIRRDFHPSLLGFLETLDVAEQPAQPVGDVPIRTASSPDSCNPFHLSGAVEKRMVSLQDFMSAGLLWGIPEKRR